MTQPLHVRFQEAERYDISRDENVVTMMAITDIGTYHAEVPMEGPKRLRNVRAKFREKAVQLMEDGVNPCEVDVA